MAATIPPSSFCVARALKVVDTLFDVPVYVNIVESFTTGFGAFYHLGVRSQRSGKRTPPEICQIRGRPADLSGPRRSETEGGPPGGLEKRLVDFRRGTAVKNMRVTSGSVR